MRGVQERGAAAVEFALVAMVLITMILGVVEVGRMWAIQASLAQAVRDAARSVAIENDGSIAEAQVIATFRPPAADAEGVAVLPGTQSGGEGDPDCRWTVEATYEAATLTGFLGDSWTVAAKGSMRCNG